MPTAPLLVRFPSIPEGDLRRAPNSFVQNGLQRRAMSVANCAGQAKEAVLTNRMPRLAEIPAELAALPSHLLDYAIGARRVEGRKPRVGNIVVDCTSVTWNAVDAWSWLTVTAVGGLLRSEAKERQC